MPSDKDGMDHNPRDQFVGHGLFFQLRRPILALVAVSAVAAILNRSTKKTNTIVADGADMNSNGASSPMASIDGDGPIDRIIRRIAGAFRVKVG